MKYYQNKSGTLFIKDFEDGNCISIHASNHELEVRYEKFIHFATIDLISCLSSKVHKAFLETTMALVNKFHEIDKLLENETYGKDN